jgi:tetratricopeptide (TPR) repeat protein
MNAEIDKIFELLDEIYDMPNGERQIALAEEAVQLADSIDDLDLQVRARFELISAAIFGGEGEKAIVAFSWCLKKYDENSENFDTYTLFWQYKWILGHLPSFPNVSRAQIDSIFGDATRRFQQEGLSLRPIYSQLVGLEMNSGNREKAAEYYQKWLLEPRDYNADCLACETNSQVKYLIFEKRDEEALKVAEPILKGEQTCGEIPHATFGHLLLPLYRLDQIELASELFTKGYRLVSANKEFLPQIAEQLEFLVKIGKTERALSLFEKHLIWGLDIKELEAKFKFYKAAIPLFETIQEETVKLNLPNTFQGFVADGVYQTKKLREDLWAEADQIAQMFDTRNGNQYFAEQLAEKI